MSGNAHDILVVGGGLAGTLVALSLLERGQRVALVDEYRAASASRVAAGLLTPIGGRRLTRVGPLERMLPTARRIYRKVERQRGRAFFREVDTLRLCRNEEEAGHYRRRRADPDYRPYLDTPIHGTEDRPEAYFIRGGGILDTEAFLEAAGAVIASRGVRQEARLEPGDVRVDREGVEWEGLRADRVVFCEGYRVRENPWFHWLPLTPVKGEMVGGHLQGEVPDQPVNRKVTLVPCGGEAFLLGSTFDRHHPDELPTEAGRRELLAHLPALLGGMPEATVTRHRAGIRPAPTDHRPMAGCHPEEPRVAVLNGLGARGALIGPYYAERLAAHLVAGEELPEEADIARFRERA
ncbi:NAD(P)/FAD-dependent oxidoreductase [Thiohalorhabdus sp. Cl-TMA]|uniref:NAD(P)/FAD-dependent oxidoreductase n=1 Tax=Thiohalorhabdus methylotrophus TaxID=3242694 RepID=A0ABV4TY48_9GAMM